LLFILVIDVPNSLVLKASEQDFLQPLIGGGRGQRISLYAHDVVLFLQPCPEELTLVKEILRVFGEASELVTNISNCSFTPITCGDQKVQVVQQFFPCSMVQFPCKYLGLPLGIKKLPKPFFINSLRGLLIGFPAGKPLSFTRQKGHFGQGCPVLYPNLSSDRAAVSKMGCQGNTKINAGVPLEGAQRHKRGALSHRVAAGVSTS
jgi:hypothetical protein